MKTKIIDYSNYWVSEKIELANIKHDVDNDRIRNIEKYVTIGKLLDIGCGLGHFADTAKRNGWSVYGIEQSDNAMKSCEKKHIKLITFDHIDKTSPNVVTMWHVIEHFNEPLQYLKNLNKKLCRGTFLFIETPNIKSMNARRNFDKWWYNQPEHINYYDPYSIRLLLKEAGFRTIKVLSVGGFFVTQQQSVVKKIDKYYWLFRPAKKVYYLFSRIFRLSDCIRVVAVKL